MNIGIGNETAQFLVWKYINRIFFTVRKHFQRKVLPISVDFIGEPVRPFSLLKVKQLWSEEEIRSLFYSALNLDPGF
jgi:hypothetical protein